MSCPARIRYAAALVLEVGASRSSDRVSVRSEAEPLSPALSAGSLESAYNLTMM